MIKIKNVQKPKAQIKKLTSVTLRIEDAEYIKEHNIVLTKLIEEAVEDLRNGGNKNDETVGT